MTGRIKNWFKDNLGFTLLLFFLIGAFAGAYASYYIYCSTQEKAIRLGAFISDTNNKIYLVQEKP